ncbi:MAG: hypothetical protein KDB14_00655 [Planctomycetales bacterium]|nr:hypothetical protein [Planctomycetales bacterium]
MSQPPRWRRGVGTLLGLPTMPIRKLLHFDASHLTSPQRRRHGLTLVLSGIEGRGPFVQSLAQGLGDVDDGAVEVFEWTTRRVFATLKHLAALRRNREQAAKLADAVMAYQAEHPAAPLHLVGHSGGAAITVFALEELARRGAAPVDSAMLLGAALSHDYDLDVALSGASLVRSFHSPLDIPHLVLGTLVFGTVDRRHTVSAGFRGFRERNLSSYQRLEQRPYRRAMFSSWHWGGHMGWTNRVFAAEHLAPLLRQSEPPKRCE